MHTEAVQLEQPMNQSAVPSPLPVRILNKGPEYFRQQNDFSNCGGLSARERLAADKYKYVKSCNEAPQSPTSDDKAVLSANSCALNCDNNNGGSSPAGRDGLVSLNNALNDWENSPRPVATLHRSGSKRQQPRPDSLLIYRRRNEEVVTVVKEPSETADGGGGGRGKAGSRNGGVVSRSAAASFLRRFLHAAHMKERLSPSNSSSDIQASGPTSQNDEDQRSSSSPSASPPLSPTSEASKTPSSPPIVRAGSEDGDDQPEGSPGGLSGGQHHDKPSALYPPGFVDEVGSVIRRLERSPRRVTSPPARPLPGGRSRAIYRSKSDLTARCYSRSAADNERFFNFCGLEAEDIEAFAQEGIAWASPDGSGRASFHFRSVSMVELEEPDAEEMSRRSEKDPDEDDEEDEGSANLPTTSVSIIERNARVIKWIYACKRAVGALKKD